MEIDKMNKIFEIVSFYDDCRWKDEGNNNLINFYKDGLDADTKLLTHWLCYITNRQTNFERIFKEGGFVFSELADKYRQKEDLLDLLKPNFESAFIRKDKTDPNKKESYSFIGKTKPNELIKEKNIENEKVIFKSRFVPADYLSILYTLHTLKEFNYSITYFITKAYHAFKSDKEHLIQKILFSLYLLSYNDIGQPKDKNIGNWEDNLEKGNKRRDEIWKYFDNHESKEDEFEEFKHNTRYHLKRAWCCLRDFLKSREFNSYFRNALEKYMDNSEIENLCDPILRNQLELPGDVWNNNPKFQECILGVKKNDNSTLNQFLRDYYDNNIKNIDIESGYPEQFDVTFDFVPRMCDKNNCAICPIGRLSEKGKDFNKICLDDTSKSKYCPVTLVGCGYKIICEGREVCKLHKSLKSWTIMSPEICTVS